MKFEFIAAAVIAIAFVMPVHAQEKPAADPPKAQVEAKNKPHSHVEDRYGIKPSPQKAKKSAPLDRSKHFHPRDR